MEHTLDLDDSLVKEYFPVSVVVPAILDIYQNLLGVKFTEIKGDARDVWHPGGSCATRRIHQEGTLMSAQRSNSLWCGKKMQ